MEASGAGSTRIHLKQSKGDRSFWNTLKGICAQNSRGEAVCQEEQGVGDVFKGGKRRGYGNLLISPFFGNCVWS